MRRLLARPRRDERLPASPAADEGQSDFDQELELLVQEELRKRPAVVADGRQDASPASLDSLVDRLTPPSDLHDRNAWDAYWNDLEMRANELALTNAMAADHSLPPLLRRRGARTILCAGNGLSIEPVELALLGFDVTSLDLSGTPAELYGRNMRNPDHPFFAIPGFRVRDDGSFAFGAPANIAPELVELPRMHHRDDEPYPGGGSLTFVTGDLTHREVCPGPFDVIIERRTLQLFEGAAQTEALERIVARLAERATLVSHQHAGWWKPPQPRTHFAADWLRQRGFAIRSQTTPGAVDTARRLAILMFSSG